MKPSIYRYFILDLNILITRGYNFMGKLSLRPLTERLGHHQVARQMT